MSSQIERVATILISVLALVVSAAALYLQSAYERSALSMQLMAFSMAPDKTHGLVCQLDIALFNPGNRDVALIGAILGQAKTVRTVEGASFTVNTKSVTYFPAGDTPGYTTYVIKGGEVRLERIKFTSCTAEKVRSSLLQDGLNEFKFSTVVLTHRGIRSSAEISFAHAKMSLDGRFSFLLGMDGQFDLLVDRASYTGGVGRGSQVFWFKGGGKVWEEGYEHSDEVKFKLP
jgi:hypothetical protein